jgi:hypothetical protein
METFWTKFSFIPAAALLTVGFSMTAHAQVVCTANPGTLPLARTEGNTEPVGDIILTCTGGTPTAAGIVVPQINLSVILNANITSRVTATSGATSFSEALLLVDEPNQPVQSSITALTSRTILNCGQVGAPDKGPSGPGVCSIVSTGVPQQTYDGTTFANGKSTCDSGIVGITFIPGAFYGCGRPNAFQGRMFSNNIVEFASVPFDPPGAGVRILRITNIRTDAAGLKPSSPITAVVSISGGSAPNISFNGGGSTSPSMEVGFTMKGFTSSTPTLSTVRITEGYSVAWKYRNISFTLANAIYMAGKYVYHVPDQAYPAQAAQNVPGVLYNTEDGFQWQNNTTNAPPSPNPPLGFSPISGSANTTKYPLASVGYGGVNTGINADGISNAGTRIALTFKTASSSLKVPSVVYLHPTGSPSTTTGVMVLTATDAAGAGPFSPGISNIFHNGQTAVYEVLFADPFQLEYADVEVELPQLMSSAQVTANLAPFYTSVSATVATPTPANPTPVAVPRFTSAGSTPVTVSASLVGLLFSFF